MGQTTISALAVFKCLGSERFVRTRRHFTKKVRFVIALVTTGRRPRPGIAKKKRIWPESGATFNVVSGMNLARGGLLRELVPPGRHSFFHVFLKVDVSRARDDRFRGPESITNSKRRKVVISRKRNTCLWEATNTNIQNFHQSEAEPRKSLAMAWQIPRQNVFLRI